MAQMYELSIIFIRLETARNGLSDYKTLAKHITFVFIWCYG